MQRKKEGRQLLKNEIKLKKTATIDANPFEKIKQKRHFSTLGQKDQVKQLSSSHSKQIDIRKNTLLKDFYKKSRSNQFIDQRERDFNSNSENADDEKVVEYTVEPLVQEKTQTATQMRQMQMREQLAQQQARKLDKKRKIFALEDSDDDADDNLGGNQLGDYHPDHFKQLEHTSKRQQEKSEKKVPVFGDLSKVIDEALQGRDDYKLDPDEEAEILLNYFEKQKKEENDKSSDNNSEPAKKKSKKDIMKEVVAKSKLIKSLRNELKEKQEEVFGELDEEYQEIYSLLNDYQKNKQKEKTTQKTEDYDNFYSMLSIPAAKKTDNTVEEEAEEALEDTKQDIEDDGIVIENFSEGSNSLLSKKESTSANDQYVDDSDDEDYEESKDEQDDESEEEDVVEEEEDAAEVGLENSIIKPSIQQDGDALDDGFEGLSDDEDEDIDDAEEEDALQTEIMNAQPQIDEFVDVPIPKDLQEISSLFDDKTAPQIRKVYSSLLQRFKGDKLSRFFIHLVQYFRQRCSKPNVDITILNPLTEMIYELSLRFSQQSVKLFTNLVSDIQKEFIEKVAKASNFSNAYPDVSTLMVLKMLSNIFPISESSHVILTPTTLFIHQVICKCPLKSYKDVIAALYLCCLSFHYVQENKKYASEPIQFLNALLLTALSKEQQQTFQDTSALSLQSTKQDWLHISNNGKTLERKRVALLASLSSEDAFPSEEEDKISLLHIAVEILLRNLNLYGIAQLCNLPEIFERSNSILKALEVSLKQRLPEDTLGLVKEFYTNFEKFSQNVTAIRKPLDSMKIKPIELPQFDPLIYDDFRGRIVSKNPEKLQEAVLRKRVKREDRAAKRELRRDNVFMRQAREQTYEREQNVRKEKYKQIVKDLDDQRKMNVQLDAQYHKHKRMAKQMRKGRKYQPK